jgi:hypothetical protein
MEIVRMLGKVLTFVLTCLGLASAAMANCFNSIENEQLPSLLQGEDCIGSLHGGSGPRVKSVSCKTDGKVSEATVYTFDHAGRVRQVFVDDVCSEQHTFEYSKDSKYPDREITVRSSHDPSQKYCSGTGTSIFDRDSHGLLRSLISVHPGEPPNVMFKKEWSSSLFQKRVTETVHRNNAGDDVCEYEDGWMQSCKTSMPMISRSGRGQPESESLHIQCNYRNRQKAGWGEITQIHVEAGTSSVADREAFDATGQLTQRWNLPGDTWNGKALGSTDTFTYSDIDNAGHWRTLNKCTVFESNPHSPPVCTATHRAIKYW